VARRSRYRDPGLPGGRDGVRRNRILLRGGGRLDARNLHSNRKGRSVHSGSRAASAAAARPRRVDCVLISNVVVESGGSRHAIPPSRGHPPPPPPPPTCLLFS